MRSPSGQLYLATSSGRRAVAQSAQAHCFSILWSRPLPGPSCGESRTRMRSPGRGGGIKIPNRGNCGPRRGERRKGERTHAHWCAAASRDSGGAPLACGRACAVLGAAVVGTPALAGVSGAQPAVARYLARRGSGRRAELQQFGDQCLAALGQLEAVGVEDAALLAPGQASNV